uniref:Uncharacterized protein n=1 Tax=Siphoviridae sp. ctr8v12 TaxID=2825685 RepID=A0A8S5QGJ7_9CAUD|nr:MAG TPA: hypothetical protein [Siphoviridae sp. ctr8v12]
MSEDAIALIVGLIVIAVSLWHTVRNNGGNDDINFG